MTEFTAEYYEYCNRKLAHYNAWLSDTKRELGTTYPGFPEDKVTNKAVTAAVATTTKSMTKKEIAVRPAHTATKPSTKAEYAVEIVRNNSKLSRVNLITMLQEELSMSKAGATTYYYNSMKKLGYA